MTLATSHQQRHNSPVPFNSGTGFGDSNIQADSRRMRHFLRPSHATRAPSMAGRGGDTFGYAGSCMPVRQPCHAPATPVWRRMAGLMLIQEATMPSIALRAIRALFPLTAVPVSTVPTHVEACALARLLVSQGKRATVAPAGRGFTVSEVKA